MGNVDRWTLFMVFSPIFFSYKVTHTHIQTHIHCKALKKSHRFSSESQIDLAEWPWALLAGQFYHA